MDKKLLLAIQHVFNKHGASIPWDEIGAVVGPKITGGAVTQHLAKLRLRQIEAGFDVPPPLKKGGINKSFSATSSSPKPDPLADPKDGINEESTDNDWEDDEPLPREKKTKDQDNAATDGTAAKPSLVVTLKLTKPLATASSAQETTSDKSFFDDDDDNIDFETFAAMEAAFDASELSRQNTYDPYANPNPINWGGMPLTNHMAFPGARDTIINPFVEVSDAYAIDAMRQVLTFNFSQENAVFNQYFTDFPVDSEAYDAAYALSSYDGNAYQAFGMTDPENSYSGVAGEGSNFDGEDGEMGGSDLSEELIFGDIDLTGGESGMNEDMPY